MRFILVIGLLVLISNTINKCGEQSCFTLYSLPAQSKLPSSLAISSQGVLASANFYSNDVTLFKVYANGTLSKGISYSPAFLEAPSVVAFSPDGSFLATAGGGALALSQVYSNATLGNTAYYSTPWWSGDELWCVRYSPNGSHLATVDHSYTINPDTVTLFTVQKNGTLSNPTKQSQSSTVEMGYLAFSPVDSYFVTTNFKANSVTLYLVSANGIQQGNTYPLPIGSEKPISLCFSPDGKYLVTLNKDDITVFPVGNNNTLGVGESYPLPQFAVNPSALTFSPDGNYLITTDLTESTFDIFSFSDGVPIDIVDYNLPAAAQEPSSIVFVSDAYFAIANSYTNNISLYDLECLLNQRKISNNAISE